MDLIKPSEVFGLASELSSVAETQFAEFLDDIARIVEESEMTYHEASWVLRTAAGHLRDAAAMRKRVA